MGKQHGKKWSEKNHFQFLVFFADLYYELKRDKL